MFGIIDFDTTGQNLNIDNTVSNEIIIDTLSQFTSYSYYVRADCGLNNIDTSIWVGPFTFTTSCGIIIPDFVEKFGAITPDCWQIAGNGDNDSGPQDLGTSNWEPGTYSGGTPDAKINLWSNSNQEWLISPEIDLGNGIYSLFIDVAVTDWNNIFPDEMGADDQVKILISTDNWTSSTVLYTWTKLNNLSNYGDNYEINLSSYSGIVSIAIWASDGIIDDGEDYDFHIDNFNIIGSSTCLNPINIETINITTNPADIVWDEIGDINNWGY